jgi:alpha-glucosidase
MSSTWWHDAVIYQIYPRSFRDSGSKGHGDIRGIIEGLPAIADLGVDAVWLSPFYSSPLADSGYDIADHRSVDPAFGTLDDVEELIAYAHQLGLRFIVDYVPNHVSDQHVWFQEALADPSNPIVRNRFHFRDGKGIDGNEPPNNWISVFNGPAWTRSTNPDGTAGQWYLHLFASEQPDVNWTNREVQEDMMETLRFWLRRGVDGFRVDVAMGMAKDMTFADQVDPQGMIDAIRLDLFDASPESFERRELLDASPIFDREEVHEYIRMMRATLDAHGSDVVTVAEAWVHPPERAARYVRPDEFHQIFNFDFLVAPWEADKLGEAINRTIDQMAESSPTWALDNHDTQRLATRLGGGEVGVLRARALMGLTLALPGSTYIYQGHELGLEDVDVPDDERDDPVWHRTGGAQLGRDGARVPLPWSGTSPPFGFTDAAATWLSQPAHWESLTREAQQHDPVSTLNFIKAAIAERKALGSAVLGVDPKARHHGNLLIVERPDFTVVVNTANEPASIVVDGDLLLCSRRVNSEHGKSSIPGNTTWWVSGSITVP